MRMSRQDYVTSRTAPRTPPTKRERLQTVMRAIRRQLIATGQLVNPATAPPKYVFHWAVPADSELGAAFVLHPKAIYSPSTNRVGSVVRADTRSEARAEIKHVLNAKHLPDNLEILRVPYATPVELRPTPQLSADAG